MVNLRPLPRSTKPRLPDPEKAVDSSAVDNNIGSFNQKDLFLRHRNKTKCERPSTTQTQAQAPKPSTSRTTFSSPSSGISTEKIASSGSSSNKIQSNKDSSTPSNSLFDQKPAVAKPKPPSMTEVASSRPLNRTGASTTLPFAQNVQEKNV